MELFILYIYAVLIVVLSGILAACARPMCKFIKTAVGPVFLWTLLYPRLFARTTRFAVLLVGALLMVNITCLLWRPSVAGLVRRSASLCVANLIPTVLGARMNFIADQCRINLGTLLCVHRWLGTMAFAHAWVHLFAVCFSQGILLGSYRDIAAYLVRENPSSWRQQ